MFYAADDALVGALPRDLALPGTVERLSHDVARGLGEGADVARRVSARFLGDARARLEASAALLARLAPRYRVGIVSNFYGNLAAVCSAAPIGRHVGAVVDSAAVGFEKPDARIFEAALEALGTRADRALFVGDSMPRDMEGARRLGMPHVWLKPGARAACCPDDAVIGRLSELTGVIS